MKIIFSSFFQQQRTKKYTLKTLNFAGISNSAKLYFCEFLILRFLDFAKAAKFNTHKT